MRIDTKMISLILLVHALVPVGSAVADQHAWIPCEVGNVSALTCFQQDEVVAVGGDDGWALMHLNSGEVLKQKGIEGRILRFKIDENANRIFIVSVVEDGTQFWVVNVNEARTQCQIVHRIMIGKAAGQAYIDFDSQADHCCVATARDGGLIDLYLVKTSTGEVRMTCKLPKTRMDAQAPVLSAFRRWVFAFLSDHRFAYVASRNDRSFVVKVISLEDLEPIAEKRFVGTVWTVKSSENKQALSILSQKQLRGRSSQEILRWNTDGDSKPSLVLQTPTFNRQVYTDISQLATDVRGDARTLIIERQHFYVRGIATRARRRLLLHSKQRSAVIFDRTFNNSEQHICEVDVHRGTNEIAAFFLLENSLMIFGNDGYQSDVETLKTQFVYSGNCLIQFELCGSTGRYAVIVNMAEPTGFLPPYDHPGEIYVLDREY